MIKVGNTVLKKQKNFWNACVFHPTDAIEDPWGRRILDRMSEDGAIHTVRIYSMFEDIVYLDENGKLCYDFRVSDLRLDYLMEKGYNLLISYAGMPDCIASTCGHKTSVSKNKTRYKGKMWNSAPPKDYKLWEDICYEYTKHNVERYGIETVSSWKIQCFNESDAHLFFLSEYPKEDWQSRLTAYCKLYKSFEKGIRRVSDDISIGGPALAMYYEFFDGFLAYVKENNLKIDFVSTHNYSTSPRRLREKIKPISISSIINHHEQIVKSICKYGFSELPVLMDEWGMSSGGFCNKEECPDLMIRESEAFSAYFVRLIRKLLDSKCTPESLMICLSGQHEMVEDFSGFRNFFTLNFIKKPIYNAFVLASKLKDQLLLADTEFEDLSIIPTKDDNGSYAVMLSYVNDTCEENLPDICETITFEENIVGKCVSVWCIDKNTTNPYRTWQAEGSPEMDEAILIKLREESTLKKSTSFIAENNSVPLVLTANSTFLITIE